VDCRVVDFVVFGELAPDEEIPNLMIYWPKMD